MCSPLCLLFCAFLSSFYRLSIAALDVEIRKIDAEIKNVGQKIEDTQNKVEAFQKLMNAIIEKSPEMSESNKLVYSGLKEDKAACYTKTAELQQKESQLRQEKLDLLRRAPPAAAPVAPSGALFDSLFACLLDSFLPAFLRFFHLPFLASLLLPVDSSLFFLTVPEILARFSGHKYSNLQFIFSKHFCQRDTATATACDAAYKNYVSRYLGQKHMQHFVFVPGGSGIGKTRFGYELQFKLSSRLPVEALHAKAAFENPLYIYIELNNAMGFRSHLDAKYPDSIRIGARIAYSYTAGDIDFNQFLDRVDVCPLHVVPVLHAIVEMERKKRKSLAPFCVIIHIDEYQAYAKIADEKKLEETGGVTFFKNMLKQIGNYMLSPAKDREVFLLPICTGTSRLRLNFEPTEYPCKVIKLTPLTRDDALAMLDEIYSGDSSWKQIRSAHSFEIVLADTGASLRVFVFASEPLFLSFCRLYSSFY